jgi:hypothetical protein
MILWSLGPKAVCAANAPVAHIGGPIVRRTAAKSLLFIPAALSNT